MAHKPAVRGDKRSQILRRVASVFDVSEPEAEAMLSIPRQQSLRINPLAGAAVEDIRHRLLAAFGEAVQPVPWCPDAYHILRDKAAIATSDLAARGEVFIQNASSFVPVLALDPQPGETILDMCAAPGGKSSHIAALTGNQATLWLNDGIAARIRKLQEVVDLLGVRAARITTIPAQYLDKELDQTFDRILLDAQCSGEGMIDLGDRQSYRFWDLERVEKYSMLQRKMLMTAHKLLKPGGVLVYSTCTFSPEEDEVPVNHLIRHRSDMSIEPLGLAIDALRPGRTAWNGTRFDASLALSGRIRPGAHMEGFYVCRLRKAA